MTIAEGIAAAQAFQDTRNERRARVRADAERAAAAEAGGYDPRLSIETYNALQTNQRANDANQRANVTQKTELSNTAEDRAHAATLRVWRGLGSIVDNITQGTPPAQASAAMAPAFDHVLPILRAAGLPPEREAELRNQFLADPRVTVQAAREALQDPSLAIRQQGADNAADRVVIAQQNADRAAAALAHTIDQDNPDVINRNAAEKAQGTAAGAALGAQQAAAPEQLALLDTIIGEIDSILLRPKDLASVTGMGAMLDIGRGSLGGLHLPGSRSADMEADLEKLSSDAFRQGIEAMRGLGSLSNAEGEAIRQASVQLSRRQSANQLTQHLQEYRALLLAISERVRARGFVAAGTAGYGAYAGAGAGAPPSSNAPPAAGAGMSGQDFLAATGR